MSKIESIKLDIQVGRIESLEDVLAFLLRLEAWDQGLPSLGSSSPREGEHLEAKKPDQGYAISRRRTDVRKEPELKAEHRRSGRDGML